MFTARHYRAVAELVASEPEALVDRFAQSNSKLRRALSLREPGYPLAETA
jgi:hypothetical protein